jgi:hypothetical protein
MAHKEPDVYANYEDYLHSHVWPKVDPRTGETETVVVDRDEMVPQYAAAALAKLVRWARSAPVGNISLLPDEDSRECEVRGTELGKALAARAVNLDVDTFFGMYGEFGVTPAADPDVVAALLVWALEEHGLDWKPRERITLALKLAREVLGEFSVRQHYLS